MNPLLKRQVQKYFGDIEALPKELAPLLNAISDAYEGFEKDRDLIERSLDLSSDELREVNNRLRNEVEMRKRTELSVLERERFLSDIFESIQDGISVLSPNLDIIRVNDAMKKMYSHMLPLEGQKCYKAYQNRDTKCDKCPSIRALETGELEMEEVDLVNEDGKTGSMEVFAFPMLDSGGKPNGVVEYVRDITKRKDAEQKQARLLDEVMKANEELTRFAYIMTHDLKSPLRGISTLTDWLKSDHYNEFSEDGRMKLDQLSTRTKRMHTLIDGLLAYTRLISSPEKICPINLNEIIQKAIESLQIPENIKVTVKQELPVIECERNKFIKIFQHLIQNAVLYMDKPQGLIEINYIDRPKYWEFCVSDNGPGIDQKYFDKIFKMFQTLERWEISGTSGVGLPLVKKAVEIHGGKIWVESVVGQGCNFYFTIPKILYNCTQFTTSSKEDSDLEEIIS
jgi:two-component system, LuxR family, sensor kinase FixL